MNAEVSSASRSVMRAARFNPLATVGLCFITIFVLFALLAPLDAPYDPAFIDLPHRLAPPSSHHWFGTDELGRDILSRIIFGARISMLVGASVVAGSLVLGLIIGSLAGYYGGRIDRFVNVIVMNAFLSFPGFLLAIAFVAFVGPGIFNLILALVIGGWVGYARLVRAQVLAVREREFVEAARALGASDLRDPYTAYSAEHDSTCDCAGGDRHGWRDSGRSDDEFSWARRAAADRRVGDRCCNDGRSHLFDAPHLVLFPAMAVMLAVLSFNFLETRCAIISIRGRASKRVSR